MITFLSKKKPTIFFPRTIIKAFGALWLRTFFSTVSQTDTQNTPTQTKADKLWKENQGFLHILLGISWLNCCWILNHWCLNHFDWFFYNRKGLPLTVGRAESITYYESCQAFAFIGSMITFFFFFFPSFTIYPKFRHWAQMLDFFSKFQNWQKWAYTTAKRLWKHSVSMLGECHLELRSSENYIFTNLSLAIGKAFPEAASQDCCVSVDLGALMVSCLCFHFTR